MFGRLATFGGLGASALRAKLTGDWRAFAREVAEFYGKRGKMFKLDVDSDAKAITVEVQLRGQAAPWRLDATGYDIVQRDGEEHLVFANIQANEAWLTTVLRFAGVANKGVKLPPEYAELAKLAL